MIDTALLYKELARAGKTPGECAAALEMTERTLKKKFRNLSQFKASEIARLIALLSLSAEQFEAIFFCPVL